MRLVFAVGAFFLLSEALAATANSHTLPWRAGEARIKGFGTCAKGPCMRRSDFGVSKPHRHYEAKDKSCCKSSPRSAGS